MIQPDLGSSLVFFAITAALVIVAGVTWKIILPLFGGASHCWWFAIMDGALLCRISLKIRLDFKAYQFARIYSWLDPYSYSTSDGYHLITSLNAIGSGEIFGKGF